MKFFADVMLGRLAKWLRILGYDVLYTNEYSVRDSMLEKALSDSRLILTRDRRLRKRLGNTASFFVNNDRVSGQLEEVVKYLQLKPSKNIFSRCIRCNTELEKMDKNAAIGLVPPYVFSTHENFKTCKTCKRVYWSATHRKHMEKEIKNIVSKIPNS